MARERFEVGIGVKQRNLGADGDGGDEAVGQRAHCLPTAPAGRYKVADCS